MIPSALTLRKRSLFAIATLFPVTLLGLGLREQTAQAHQQAARNQSAMLPNGLYLYGNAPQPNQLAHDYVVFERHNGQVVGAFYSPRSEFTCFSGELQGTQLDVEALVPEETETHEIRAQLANLYPLQQVSANDQRMLTMCKQEKLALAARQ